MSRICLGEHSILYQKQSIFSLTLWVTAAWKELPALGQIATAHCDLDASSSIVGHTTIVKLSSYNRGCGCGCAQWSFS